MDNQAQAVADLMKSLRDNQRVYASCCRGAETDLPARVFELAQQVETEWGADRTSPFDPAPATVEELTATLQPVDQLVAVELLSRFATVDLVFDARMTDRHHEVRLTAQAIVSQLGPRARWFTNRARPPLWSQWTPVTGCTFDAVIAGAGSGQIVVLLQVAED